MFKTHVTALFTKKSKLSLNILFKRKKWYFALLCSFHFRTNCVTESAITVCYFACFFVFNLYVLKRSWTSSINVRFFVIFFFQIFLLKKKLYEKACLLPYVYLFQLKY